MEFHPNKCQVIHINNKRKHIRQPFNIHGHVLQKVEPTKYLGSNTHHKLNWTTRIDQVVRKAKNNRAFLQKRYIIYQCQRKTNELFYKTLVRPRMEYALIIWDQHTANNPHNPEMVQIEQPV